MNKLFDSKGNFIAVEQGGKLYLPTGQHFGNFISSRNIYVDTKGYYLGEVLQNNRLVFRNNHPDERVCYGSQGYGGSIGTTGNPGFVGSIGMPSNYRDIGPERLKA